MKKIWILGVLAAVAALMLTGCVPTDLTGAQAKPTETAVIYDSTDALAKAIDAQKSGNADDAHKLATLDHYYGFQTLPKDAKIDSIKVLSFAVRVLYTFGPTAENTYDNRMELVWYRDTTGSDYMSKVAADTTLKALNLGNQTYYKSVAKVQLAENSSETKDYCQIVYWAQDNQAYMAAVPMSFTDEDIAKYCVAQQMPMQ